VVEAVAVALGAGASLGDATLRAVAEGRGEGAVLAEAEISALTGAGASRVADGLATAAAGLAGGVDSEAVAVACAGAASVGFTKVRDGALGGGVASLFILARTFSAA
jgi:hypothetical protein